MRLLVENLVRRFGSAPAVDGISIEVRNGEFVALLGPSGCGKTTTLRLLAGFELPDAGRIAIGDRVVADLAQRVFVPAERRGIGMVFQSYAIWPHMTVFENVAYPLRVRRMSGQQLRRRVDDVLALVGLGGEASRPATSLSGGQQQRVALARALVYEPAVLLLDEPLSNLDVKLRERLRGELKAVQRRTGVTSVYVTHDQNEAMELGDRVAVMDHGRLLQYGTPDELWNRPRTRFVAEFVGSANILPARVEAGAGEGLVRVVVTGGPRVLASCDGAFDEPVGRRADGEVLLVIRPEHCMLDGTERRPAHGNEWPVLVRESRTQGAAVHYTLDLAGCSLHAVALGADRPPDGTRAYLRVAPDRARIVEA